MHLHANFSSSFSTLHTHLLCLISENSLVLHFDLKFDLLRHLGKYFLEPFCSEPFCSPGLPNGPSEVQSISTDAVYAE